MRQRLGIAAALLRDPKLLLLDEPATGLDPAGMRDMRLLIRRLADQGMTVLLSSHLLAEVEELCNRVAIVRSGKIVYEGEIAALKRGAGTVYRLSTHRRRARDDGLPRRSRGSATLRVEHGQITFTADEPAVAELSQALVEAGALIQALAPETVTLEDLFFSLTEGDGVVNAGLPAGKPARGGVAMSRASAPQTRPAAAPARRRGPGTLAVAAGGRDRLPVGADEAPLPEADLPRARRGGDRADPVRGRGPLPPPSRPRRRLRVLSRT